LTGVAAERPSKSPDAAVLNRAPKSTSLNRLINRKTEEIHPPAPPLVEESKSFGTEDLIRCWDAYAETIEKEIHLKNTMLSCKPLLLENAHFEVRVHNPMQEEELIGHSLQLLKTLREQLSNSKIQMHIRIDDSGEKKRAYTDIEKYELLCQINPLLSKLKDEFDLSFE
jgi:DNA polymerase-3 subunit gamma/tau